MPNGVVLKKSEFCEPCSIERSRKTALKMTADFFWSNVPVAFKELGLTDFSTEYRSITPFTPLFISGPAGTGKTALACCVVYEWAKNAQRRLGYKFCLAWDFLAEIKASFDRDARENEMEIVTRYSSIDVLILDDIGSNHSSDYNLSALTALLTKREHSNLVTIVTSNLGLKEIDAVEPRIASRLFGFQQIQIQPKDMRGKTRGQPRIQA